MGKAWTSIRQKGKFFFDLITNERLKIHILQALPFWVASLLTGLIAVLYTKLFGYSEHLLQKALHWKAWSIFLLTPICFFIAWLLVQRLAPNAKGSGIPQVMAAIELATPRNDSKVGKLLSIRIVIVKIASSMFMVLGGAAIGREGPTIQIAGSVFRFINKRTPASWPKLSRQNFILTGAAAGLAAAFNTPLGGVVFAMEELASTHLRFFRTALFTAVIIAGLTAQALLGPYLYLGFPDVRNLAAYSFVGVIVTALISGFLGALMCKLILRMMRWKKNFSKGKSIAYLFISGLVIATVAFFLNGEILGSGKELMNQVLFTNDKYASWDTALIRFVGPIICFNTGAAGGVFAPSLATGATIGSCISGLFDLTAGNANILILSGMVGFLTGVTRTPFTSAILVLEMTDRHSVIFYLMIAALFASMSAILADRHSFYDQLKKGYLDDALSERIDNSPDVSRT